MKPGEPPLLVDLHARDAASMVRTVDGGSLVGGASSDTSSGGRGGSSGSGDSTSGDGVIGASVGSTGVGAGAGLSGVSNGKASGVSGEESALSPTSADSGIRPGGVQDRTLATRTLALLKHLHSTGAIDGAAKTQLFGDVVRSVSDNTTSAVVSAFTLLVQGDDVSDFVDYCVDWVARGRGTSDGGDSCQYS